MLGEFGNNVAVLYYGMTVTTLMLKSLSTNILPINEAIIEYLYLQRKQQP